MHHLTQTPNPKRNIRKTVDSKKTFKQTAGWTEGQTDLNS